MLCLYRIKCCDAIGRYIRAVCPARNHPSWFAENQKRAMKYDPLSQACFFVISCNVACCRCAVTLRENINWGAMNSGVLGTRLGLKWRQ
jgi:hypothetical protein